MIGCGADEVRKYFSTTLIFTIFICLQKLIDLVLRAILEPKDVLINTPPTFGMYEFDCSINSMF